jgi:NTE family protein
MPKRTVDAGDTHPVLVDLALQGGGSHGAFTWGVLDRLLEEPWLEIEAISGTSAGAMNGAVLVSGFMGAAPRGHGRRSTPIGVGLQTLGGLV